MKVTIDRKDKETDKPFPKLMVNKLNNSLLVFFRHEGCGEVVNPGSGFPVCFETDEWDLDTFKDFPGTITIEND